VREDYPTTAMQMEKALADLRAAVARAELDVSLLPGGELDLEEIERRDEVELVRFGLGGNPRFLLLEFPYSSWPLPIAGIVARLIARGITPILAHPERNDAVQRQPAALAPLVEAGALVQLTAGSLTGALGARSHTAAFELLAHDWAHLVASDTHSEAIPRAPLGAVRDAVRDERLASWLVCEIPSAIVEDRQLPERPARGGRPSRLRARRG
jgi:protein-tyrosine phosphatase